MNVFSKRSASAVPDSPTDPSPTGPINLKIHAPPASAYPSSAVNRARAEGALQFFLYHLFRPQGWVLFYIVDVRRISAALVSRHGLGEEIVHPLRNYKTEDVSAQLWQSASRGRGRETRPELPFIAVAHIQADEAALFVFGDFSPERPDLAAISVALRRPFHQIASQGAGGLVLDLGEGWSRTPVRE